jgi:hypothetical protein
MQKQTLARRGKNCGPDRMKRLTGKAKRESIGVQEFKMKKRIIGEGLEKHSPTRHDE